MKLNIERNARCFPTLDLAIAWAESNKMAWMREGWIELPPDLDDR